MWLSPLFAAYDQCHVYVGPCEVPISLSLTLGSNQVGGDLEVGSSVTLRVLDVNKANGIVELTAKEDICESRGKKLKAEGKIRSKAAPLPAVRE